MTSPRQRKKRAALLARKKSLEEQAKPKTVQKVEPKLESPPAPVVESGSAAVKLKKPILTKNALVETKPVQVAETKSQDQVVEQPKEEVKTSTGE